MKTGVYLSYVGLGANLLHLSYCHEIAKRHGPVTVITLCKNLEAALADDPLVEKVFYIDRYHKKLIDIFNLAEVLKSFDFKNLLVFYPSIRLYLSAKLAGIKNVSIYNIFKKKNLHLVRAAKKLTEDFGYNPTPEEKTDLFGQRLLTRGQSLINDMAAGKFENFKGEG